MRRWMRAAHLGLGYLLAGVGCFFMVSHHLAAIGTQLKYGYAVGRNGEHYNVWTLPLALLAACALFLGWLCWEGYRSRRAGHGAAQGITYPVSPKVHRKRRRRRRH